MSPARPVALDNKYGTQALMKIQTLNNGLFERLMASLERQKEETIRTTALVEKCLVEAVDMTNTATEKMKIIEEEAKVQQEVVKEFTKSSMVELDKLLNGAKIVEEAPEDENAPVCTEIDIFGEQLEKAIDALQNYIENLEAPIENEIEKLESVWAEVEANMEKMEKDLAKNEKEATHLAEELMKERAKYEAKENEVKLATEQLDADTVEDVNEEKETEEAEKALTEAQKKLETATQSLDAEKLEQNALLERKTALEAILKNGLETGENRAACAQLNIAGLDEHLAEILQLSLKKNEILVTHPDIVTAETPESLDEMKLQLQELQAEKQALIEENERKMVENKQKLEENEKKKAEKSKITEEIVAKKAELVDLKKKKAESEKKQKELMKKKAAKDKEEKMAKKRVAKENEEVVLKNLKTSTNDFPPVAKTIERVDFQTPKGINPKIVNKLMNINDQSSTSCIRRSSMESELARAEESSYPGIKPITSSLYRKLGIDAVTAKEADSEITIDSFNDISNMTEDSGTTMDGSMMNGFFSPLTKKKDAEESMDADEDMFENFSMMDHFKQYDEKSKDSIAASPKTEDSVTKRFDPDIFMKETPNLSKNSNITPSSMAVSSTENIGEQEDEEDDDDLMFNGSDDDNDQSMWE